MNLYPEYIYYSLLGVGTAVVVVIVISIIIIFIIIIFIIIIIIILTIMLAIFPRILWEGQAVAICLAPLQLQRGANARPHRSGWKDDLRDIVFVTDVSAQSSGEYSKASFQNGPTFQGPTSRLMKYHQIHSGRCWFRYITGISSKWRAQRNEYANQQQPPRLNRWWTRLSTALPWQPAKVAPWLHEVWARWTGKSKGLDVLPPPKTNMSPQKI